ncbi:MAG TPA: response regulator transcription factor [Anaerolineaceae bacterium]|nr:response regulator transcription factor [Anaerolineaceae bacterium]
MVGECKESVGNRIITVVVADDHHFTRSVVRDYINQSTDIRVVGEAASGMEALTQTHALHPDVLLLDMEMNGMSGIDVVRELTHENQPQKSHIVALSAHNDRQFILAVLDLGVDRYITKDEPIRVLVDAIRLIASRKAISHPRSTQQVSTTL